MSVLGKVIDEENWLFLKKCVKTVCWKMKLKINDKLLSAIGLTAVNVIVENKRKRFFNKKAYLTQSKGKRATALLMK